MARERIRNDSASGSWDEFEKHLESTPPGNSGNIGQCSRCLLSYKMAFIQQCYQVAFCTSSHLHFELTVCQEFLLSVRVFGVLKASVLLNIALVSIEGPCQSYTGLHKDSPQTRDCRETGRRSKRCDQHGHQTANDERFICDQ